jgi:hypothetical protein
MYADYISEKMSNVNTQNVSKRVNNSIFQNTPESKIESKIENFSAIDPSLNYIIKRDYNNISDASCIAGDNKDVSNNTCYICPKTFYPTTTYLDNSYTISPLPFSILDPTINKNTFYATINSGSNSTPRQYNGPNNYRETNFIFSNEGNVARDVKSTGSLETIIADYIQKLMSAAGASSTNNFSMFTPATIRDALLLKNSYVGIVYEIPDIYKLLNSLVTKFEPFFDPKFNTNALSPNNGEQYYSDADLSIVNNSKLIVLVDPATYTTNTETNSVYSLILKISVSIKTANISPVSSGTKNYKITDFDDLVKNFDHFIYDKGIFNYYTYEKEITFPLLLSFNLPNKLPDGTADVNNTNWSDNIIKYVNTLLIDNQLLKRNLLESLGDGDIIVDIKKLLNRFTYDNSIINNITNIYALYAPTNPNDKNDMEAQQWTFSIRIIIDPSQPNYNLLGFNNNYSPNFCMDSTSILYNNDGNPKCIPICPPNYNIDLGLVCLKTGITNYTPDSDFCKSVKGLTIPTDTTSILYGLIKTCDQSLLINNVPVSVPNVTSTGGTVNTSPKKTVSGFDKDGKNLVIKTLNFTNVHDFDQNTIQHFENYELPVDNYDIKNDQRYNPMNPIRKDSKRYSVDSRPETKPVIQNNREVKHFYPFEN